jgi:predicted AAA+ superfamily ATPase
LFDDGTAPRPGRPDPPGRNSSKKYTFLLGESWRSPEWQRDDPDLRVASAAPFAYRSVALSDLTAGGLYVLRGPRRAGKSTEIKHAISDLLASSRVYEVL